MNGSGAEELADEIKKIIIISDGTGKTAKRLMDAVLYQYNTQQVRYKLVKVYQEVRDRKSFDAALKEIGDDYLVVVSIISDDLRAHAHNALMERELLHLNVLEPMLKTMSKFLGVHPDYKPGILQIVDDRYYRKVDAIGFTVEHDDGMGNLINEADVVLIGLSRTCKTPISVYLACNIGLKAANIPIVPDTAMRDSLLKRLQSVEGGVVFGLLMKPDILLRVREERARVLSGDRYKYTCLDEYADIKQIQKELRFCRELFAEIGCPVIDVSRRAIEEVSVEIVSYLQRNGFDSPSIENFEI
ncbi:MAG: pyruvate, phosphate dikinase/phosphoenolpyruvate synthase regulator [candidate division Zixibacteria bacterium]|nr:pyruvate, phosphate dikinase/phosphoenolpyruvate synthase regulator [candidate division Zixibacteria bacterium]